MNKRSEIGARVALAVIAGGGLCALYLLLVLRFHVSESLPAGSTWLTSPRGASVFYEALARIPGVTVRRQLEPHAPPTEDACATWFATGVEVNYASFSPDADMRAAVARGGRLVIAYAPVTYSHWATNTAATGFVSRVRSAKMSSDHTNTVARRAVPPSDEEGDAHPGASLRPSFFEEGLEGVVVRTTTTGLTTRCAGRLPVAPAALPAKIPMRSALVFTNVAPVWTVLYRTPEGPVVVERRWGTGSIVLVADDYIFSNEALWRDCPAEWLAWTVGAGRLVVFDETHHGLVRSTTLMTLVRDLGLTGFFIALAVVAVLVFWQQSFPLMPPAALASDAPLAGHGSHEGLVRLLRRSLTAQQALVEGFARWEHSAGRSLGAVRLAHVRETFERARDADAVPPVEIFRALQKASRPGSTTTPHEPTT